MDIGPYEAYRAAALAIAITILVLTWRRWKSAKAKDRKKIISVGAGAMILLVLLALFAGKATSGRLSIPFYGHAQNPFGLGPEVPVSSMLRFFFHVYEFGRADDIARDPTDVPPAIGANESVHHKVWLEATEVLAEVTDGSVLNYWTFNTTVPGPMLRVRQGDLVTLHLRNNPASLHMHSIDLHAVTGPGGGAKVLQVRPGEEKSLTFKALQPGLYIYHCASPDSVAAHMTHGMYGLILVEPIEGLDPVDKEFYVVQGEFYTRGHMGDSGLAMFDASAMLDEEPTYVVFNGRIGGVNKKMVANVGDTVRIYFGNAGVAKVSSFHVIGEIFDRVYPEASIGSQTHTNVQSTMVPAGGAAIVEFDVDYPGEYALVDHSLARGDRGAWGVLHVDGKRDPSIFDPHDE